jgi:hypothetical protein
MMENKMTENDNVTTENPVDNILDSLKGGLQSCLVMGFDNDGKYVMSSSINNVPTLHWMLNKSIFEIHLFEKQQEAQNAAAAQQEVSPENNEGDADVDAGNSD